jgi:dipeptidyl aminopeptidase/acylaminoacyl peptidase
MRPFIFSCFRVATLLGLLWVPASLVAKPLIPLETFFGTEAVSQMQLSPDGNKVAMIAPNGGRYSLAMLDLTTGKASVVVRLADENIREFFWKGSDRLLFYALVDGHEVPLLASIDIQGKEMKRILEPRLSEEDASIFFGHLVDRFPSDDESILILGYTDRSDAKAEARGSFNMWPTVYRVNVNTARRTKVFARPEDEDEGLFNAQAQQRLSTLTEGNKIKFGIRSRHDQPLKIIRTFDITDIPWDVRTVMADDRTVYLIDKSVDKFGALRSLDLESEKLSEPLFTPQAGEIRGLYVSPRRKRLLGVSYEDTHARVHWIDPKWASIGAALDGGFPDQRVAITSISEDEKRFLFLVYSDRNPGMYYLGDLRSGAMQVQAINAVLPAIKPEEMSPMEPIQYQARDGLTIHGYLTKPGGKVDRKTPLLLMPHGGPYGPRDSWGFNAEVQFLASRGYAVLQVNFRGSGGYGDAFERAGYGEWGGKMQDDLTDAVKWAIEQGYADPDRIGIIGASYGGYAALAGVTMTPELYKVGINYVGVSDIRLINRRGATHTAASKAVWSMRFGKDQALLREKSPVFHVANIRVPTLHAYGRNDPRVTIENWTALEAELKKHNKPYEVLIEKNEGHGFEKAENSIKFYRAVEAFLTKHMPAGPK